MVAKFVDTTPFCRHGDKKRCVGKAILPQCRLDGFAHLADARVIHAIGFGQRHGQLRVAGQLQDRQVLAGLRHHAVIAGHHQQGMIDAAHAR